MKKSSLIPIITVSSSFIVATPIIALTSCSNKPTPVPNYKVTVNVVDAHLEPLEPGSDYTYTGETTVAQFSGYKGKIMFTRAYELDETQSDVENASTHKKLTSGYHWQRTADAYPTWNLTIDPNIIDFDITIWIVVDAE